MKLIHNSGNERVIDFIRPFLKRDHQLHIITSKFSLFAFAEILNRAFQLVNCRHHLFKEKNDTLDEEQIVKAATGIHETKMWN